MQNNGAVEKVTLNEVRTQIYKENEPVVVSVAMIAYNVEEYIAEAIESVLDQRTNFRVQLIVGEDSSMDRTRDIALDYQLKFPDVIKVLLPEKNQGLTPNCIATINACDGKFIALLDSDDYWTNPNKLQTQISFLMNNPDYSGSGHQSIKIYNDQSKESTLFGSYTGQDYELEDMISHRKFHTSSFIFRKEIWDLVGGIPTYISSNERAIYPMVASFGKIQYLKEPMCVYRFSGFGLSSRIDYKELSTDLSMLRWLKSFNKSFPVSSFRSFIHLCAFTYGTKRIPFFPLVKHYFLFVLFSFSRFPNNLGDVKYGTKEMMKKLLPNFWKS
jgi:glycosyltransferase involved in cell wall biosynthesis